MSRFIFRFKSKIIQLLICVRLFIIIKIYIKLDHNLFNSFF